MAASMMLSNAFLLIFAVAFMGCVLATPVVTRIAVWAGAIDRPDQFRRIHKGAIPRLGGLGLAFGILFGVTVVVAGGYLEAWEGLPGWVRQGWAVLAAGLLVLGLGFVDDTRALGPRLKLLGQAAAVMVLYLGGVRIEAFDLLGWEVSFVRPAFTLGFPGYGEVVVAVPSLAVTTFWFLGCMNIWNLIDGMDGLASGVGFLVSGTLALVAIHYDNVGVAVTAAALAGSLAGFLLYNWHPACIFLGDSGSLLIGLLIGVIGVQGSFKGPSAISILFPILAMGLPISDTALAIFRRWVRNLPLSAADRRHVHHLLIGLGLNPRQAALLLYCFSGFLCGAVLLGVAWRSEELALVLSLSGCLAFLLVLTSRLNELSSLRGDFRARFVRGRQERFAAKVTWEAIQRIEVSQSLFDVCAILEKTTRALGCDAVRIACSRDGLAATEVTEVSGAVPALGAGDGLTSSAAVSGAAAIFRLSCGQDLVLTVALHQGEGSPLAADIAFRFLQRLSASTAERLERLLSARPEGDESGSKSPAGLNAKAGASAPAARRDAQALPAPAFALTQAGADGAAYDWFREALAIDPRPVAPRPSLGEE